MGTVFWPAWITHEVQQALEEIDAGHRTKDTGKKWDTVLLLAEEMAKGRALNDVLWEDNETCVFSTWYGKGGDRDDRAWRRDPAIAAAFDLALKAAIAWHSSSGARARDKAKERLWEEAPKNVQRLVDLREDMWRTTQDENDTGLRIRAAKATKEITDDMLDRADEALASKVPQSSATSSQVTVFLPDNRRGDGPPCEEDEGADDR